MGEGSTYTWALPFVDLVPGTGMVGHDRGQVQQLLTGALGEGILHSGQIQYMMPSWTWLVRQLDTAIRCRHTTMLYHFVRGDPLDPPGSPIRVPANII